MDSRTSPTAPLATLTFLFTDIEGSTRQWEESPAMAERVGRHFELLRAAVDANEGDLFATMGDGIAAAFPSARAAVRAAIAAQQALPQVGLSVRMGLHTGEVERIGDDYTGRPVNRAARIMSVAHGGQILVSDLSAALLRPDLDSAELIDLGSHRLRDLNEPERLWQVRHPDLDDRFPPLRTISSPSSTLPSPRSSLVGRDRDTQRVLQVVDQHRLVTLTGVGGVGKTRLALHAATELLPRFADVRFVELAGVLDPADVPDAVALALGAAAVTDPVASITSAMPAEPTLLLLDSCEHVVQAAAELIDALSSACGKLWILTTSREALGIDGEQVIPVRPLDPGTTAVQLFVERATAAGADPDPADRPAVERLCHRLDGLPLAIELAAARAAALGIAGIVDALDTHHGLLSGHSRHRSLDRHTTMRATMDWSHRLLEPDEQRLFQRLAVCVNGFELDTVHHLAAAIGIDGPSATDHLASLVQRSMVVAEPTPYGARYRMLETMRTFALEQLDERGERTAGLTALADWVTTLTDLPFTDCCSADVMRSSLRLEREASSWREAVAHAARTRSGELAGRLCGPPVAFFLLGRHDLAGAVRPLLELPADDFRQRRGVLCALVVASSGGPDASQLEAWVDEISEFELEEPTGLAGLMQWLVNVGRGDFDEAIGTCITASCDARIARSTRDLFVGIATLDWFSLTGATTDTHDLIERALEVADRSEVGFQRATCLLGAAWGMAQSAPDQAVQLVRRALQDIDDVPALTRLTLPGSASRLLARLDPPKAARGLLDLLEAAPSNRSSFMDLVPIFYAIELLDRLGLGLSLGGQRGLVGPPIAPTQRSVSMMDFVALARRASATDDPARLRHLGSEVRAALASIVTDHDHQPTEIR